MSAETLFDSKPSQTSSSSFGESSNPQRKNKRYVKKKGEIKKRNSSEMGSRLRLAKGSVDVDDASKKLEGATMSGETEGGPSLTENNNLSVGEGEGRRMSGRKVKEEVEDCSDLNGEASKVGRDAKKNSGTGKNNGKKFPSEIAEVKKEFGEESAARFGGKEGGGKSAIVKKPPRSKEKEKGKGKEEEKKGKNSDKNFEKGKTEEQKKRDRQTARFARAVARFSMKFTEAAKELGIIPRKESSTSWSDSSSVWTDSSCSSSCTCSDCCTTDSSFCSCSGCHSPGCSTCSSSPSTSGSSGTSGSTLNSSSTSASSPTTSSS